MATISFRLAEDGVSVEAIIHDFAPPIPNEEDLILSFRSSEYAACKLLEEKIPEILGCLPEVTPESEAEAEAEAEAESEAEGDVASDESAAEQAYEPLAEPLVFPIAQKLDALLEITVPGDLMHSGCRQSRLCPVGRGLPGWRNW